MVSWILIHLRCVGMCGGDAGGAGLSGARTSSARGYSLTEARGVSVPQALVMCLAVFW